MKKKTFYITTPIYYPSSDLHIGHLYTTTNVWALRNYKRLMGYDAIMSTGVDEHGKKIYDKAIENMMTPQNYVNWQNNKIINLWKEADIDYDIYTRTSNSDHWLTIKKVFSQMILNGDIYKGKYEGLYSINDEEYVTKTNAIIENGKYYHPISKHELIVLSEESYFFNLSKFRNFLINNFFNSDVIKSEVIINELNNNFLKDNLEDLSVTRIKIDWGIPINENQEHFIYVWLDALFSYLSSLGFLQKDNYLYKKYWENGDERVNVIGKEISRFHCIYWPIFLKSLNLKLPTKILSHGWIITADGKMSKSKGNVIDPIKLLKKYDNEALKYFFVAKLSMRKDSPFSEDLIINAINSDLVNNFGNLISRTSKMIENNYKKSLKYNDLQIEEISQIYEQIESQINNFVRFANNFELDLAFEEINILGNKLNLFIDKQQPWKLSAIDINLEQVLLALMNGIYAMAWGYQIVLPKKMAKLASDWGLENFDYKQIINKTKFNKILITKSQNLYSRLK